MFFRVWVTCVFYTWQFFFGLHLFVCPSNFCSENNRRKIQHSEQQRYRKNLLHPTKSDRFDRSLVPWFGGSDGSVTHDAIPGCLASECWKPLT